MALGSDEYDALAAQVEGSVTGWIDYAAVKPVISDFQVDTGIYDNDNETADADIVLEVKAERGSSFVIENNGTVVSATVVISEALANEAGLSESVRSGQSNTTYEYDLVTYQITFGASLTEDQIALQLRLQMRPETLQHLMPLVLLTTRQIRQQLQFYTQQITE